MKTTSFLIPKELQEIIRDTKIYFLQKGIEVTSSEIFRALITLLDQKDVLVRVEKKVLENDKNK